MHLRPHRRPPSAQRGLTLLELLVVVAILAAVAGIGAANLYGVIDDSKVTVARAEMQQIAKAIRQFKQDTGYYPKQGPFGLALSPYDGGIAPAALPAQAGASNAEREAWFYSPANFWQLFECPEVTSAYGHPEWLGCNGGGAQSWDPARGRGWRGPYLQSGGDGWVDLSSDLAADGSGSPIETAGGAWLLRVPGVADPFSRNERNQIDVLPAFDPDEVLLDWRSVATAGPDSKHYLGTIGQPYLVLDLDDSARARILGLGPDGEYDGVHPTDPCVGALDDGDDLVLCLE